MYFSFFKLNSWDKRSAVRRRRFIQRLLKGRCPAGAEGWMPPIRSEPDMMKNPVNPAPTPQSLRDSSPRGEPLGSSPLDDSLFLLFYSVELPKKHDFPCTH